MMRWILRRPNALVEVDVTQVERRIFRDSNLAVVKDSPLVCARTHVNTHIYTRIHLSKKTIHTNTSLVQSNPLFSLTHDATTHNNTVREWCRPLLIHKSKGGMSKSVAWQVHSEWRAARVETPIGPKQREKERESERQIQADTNGGMHRYRPS